MLYDDDDDDDKTKQTCSCTYSGPPELQCPHVPWHVLHRGVGVQHASHHQSHDDRQEDNTMGHQHSQHTAPGTAQLALNHLMTNG